VTTHPSLTPAALAAKWHGVAATEKASAQEHFIDLCRMLGEPTPHEADPIGAQYAFEKRVSKAAGGDGFADVWKRDFFAWEYKGRNKDLQAAYVQLMGYKDDLGNPPLLVVSDLERIEIHTNFTGLSPIVKQDQHARVTHGMARTQSPIGHSVQDALGQRHVVEAAHTT
jgi:hypothetical protein